jgi:MinD-like ATPase involved in chromosome partitioning or flagellar assembly
VVAVTGAGGGAGRTTVTAALGLVYAEYETSVAAVDATPTPTGMLGTRVGGGSAITVHQFLAGMRLGPPQQPHPASPPPEAGSPQAASPTRAASASTQLTTVPATPPRARAGLRVLAGERPDRGRGVNAAALAGSLVGLAPVCPLLLLDCQPAYDQTSWPWVGSRAAAVVFVARYAEADIQLLAEVLNGLQRIGMTALAHRAVVVLNKTIPRAPGREAQRAATQLQARVRSIHPLPYDPALAGGKPIELDRLDRKTRNALSGIAMECATRF